LAIKAVYDDAMNAGIPVDVWQIPIGSEGDADASLLDEDERRRAAAFKFDVDRRRFIAAHAALRMVLSQATGLGPRALRLEMDAAGKPHLEASDWQFNLSHSDDLALLAVARGIVLGVDVERIRPLKRNAAREETGQDETLALAERHYSPAENQHLRTLSGADRDRGFFLCWTRKEAVVKAIGTGIFTDLTRIEAGFEGTACVGALHLQTLRLDAVWAGQGYVAALAGEPGPHGPRMRSYPQDLIAA
jgi:4'-phosphopantetheinyl transferase